MALLLDILGAIGSVASIMGEARYQTGKGKGKDEQPLPVEYSDNDGELGLVKEKIDEYLSKAYHGYHIPEEEKSEAKEWFYEQYGNRSDVLMYKEDCNLFLDDFFRVLENYLNENTSAGEKFLARKIDSLITMIRKMQVNTSSDSHQKSAEEEEIARVTRAAERIGRVISDNSIRRLSEDLWINWKTGVLAADFRSALTEEEGPGRDAALEVIFDFKKEGKKHLLRLLSILVQAEGGFVDYRELDLRMVTMLPPKGKKDAGRDLTERPKSLFMDMGDESWYKYSENRIKKVIRDLRSISEKLAAIIDDPDSTDAIDGIALHIQLADTDDEKARKKNPHDTGSLAGFDASGTYESRGENPSNDKTAPDDGNEDDYEYGEYEDTYDSVSEEHRAGEKEEYYRLYLDYIRHYCKSSEGADGGRDTLEQESSDNSENAVYELRKKLAERDKKTLRGAKDDNGRATVEYKQAWFRQYYAQSCHDFETDSMSAVSNNDADAVKDMFGDYKMAQVYRNAYAAISVSGREKPKNQEERWTQKERWTEQPDQYCHARTTVMLDYVESWFGQTDGKGKGRYGKVLVLHGQPGDGKTTFCKKAVYAHCKEGWLSENRTSGAKESGDKKADDEAVETHVVRFSLNPADSNNEIHESGLLRLEKGLCFAESKGSSETYRIPVEALEHALVIFDGYDELSSQLSGDSQANTFALFCDRVLTLAQTHQFNAIITSRTMCIKDELEGDAVDGLSAVKAAPFARSTDLCAKNNPST